MRAQVRVGSGPGAMSIGSVFPAARAVLSFLRRYTTYLSTQEGLWRARDLLMVGFMGEEESAQVLQRQAIDQLKRKRLRRMIKRRQFNKGESRSR